MNQSNDKHWTEHGHTTSAPKEWQDYTTWTHSKCEHKAQDKQCMSIHSPFVWCRYSKENDCPYFEEAK